MASTSRLPGPPQAKPKPPVVQPGVSSILVNPVQRGNPLIPHIKHVAYQFAEIAPDYQVGTTTCVLYLSLKYHRLHPEYIHARIEKIQGLYGLRILLLFCDVTEHQDYIRELTRICLINNITIMVAWSLEEAGVYLSTYKLFEHKPPDLIKERVDNDYDSILRSALTSVKSVNKTDVTTLKSQFGSFSNIVHATPAQLLDCPGFGNLKARRLKDAVDKPFHPRGTQTQGKKTTAPATSTTTTATRSQPTQPLEFGQTAGTSSSSLPPISSVNSTARASPKSGQDSDAPQAPRPPQAPAATRVREPSPDWPEWDIDLDLNESDNE